MSDLQKAAQMALEYLDAPTAQLFKDARLALRAALAQPESLEPAGEEDMKVYAAIAEGYGRLEKRIGCVQHDCDVCQARVLAQPEPDKIQKAVEAGATLSARLQHQDSRWEQPEPEPVAYQWLGTSVIRKRVPKTAEADAWQPLYTHPPQRKPLTRKEILDRAIVEMSMVIKEQKNGIGGEV